MSQKYPKAPFAELVKMVHDVKDVYKECCEGDMVECVDDWVGSLTILKQCLHIWKMFREIVVCAATHSQSRELKLVLSTAGRFLKHWKAQDQHSWLLLAVGFGIALDLALSDHEDKELLLTV